jgi:hypothetical protein
MKQNTRHKAARNILEQIDFIIVIVVVILVDSYAIKVPLHFHSIES